MKIVLARIDDRLIHGQVATVWSKATNCQRIIVCDDDVAKDKIRSTLLKQVAPAGIKSHVVDLAKAVRVYNNPKYKDLDVLLVVESPQDVIRLMDAGLPVDKVNVGGAELIARGHGLLLGGDDAAVDDLDGVGQRLFEGGVLALKLGDQRGELRQVSAQRNGEHANAGFGFD